MVNLSFTACSFHIRGYNRKGVDKVKNLNQNITIETEDGSENVKNIEELIYSFFDEYSELIIENNMDKTFCVEYDENSKGENERYCYYKAKVKSGYYGNSSEIKNIKTKEVKFQKSVDDVDEMTFEIFIVIPKDNDKVIVQKGLIFFVNKGAYGVKTITTKHFQSHLSSSYQLSIIFRGIAPRMFVEKVITKDSLNKLILTKNHKSGNLAQSIYQGFGKEIRSLNVVNLPNEKWLEIKREIDHFINGKNNMYEFQHELYEGAKVEVMMGDRNRTINLHNLENLSIIEHLPKDLLLSDGSVDGIKLTNHLQEASEGYLDEMVLSII